MTDTRGVFSLKVARIFKSKGEWTPLDQVWSAPSGRGGTTPNFGYFAAGNSPSSLSSIDKIDFANDTTAVVPGTNFTYEYYSWFGSTSSSVAGYFGGGSSPTGRMDKLDYSNDTVAYTPGLDLGERERPVATGNKDAGYFAGGKHGGSFSSVIKVSYLSDTKETLPSGANLFAGRYWIYGASSTTAGYFAGGRDPSLPPYSNTSKTDKLTYSTDTTALAPGANLTASNYMFNGASIGNSTNGYFSGGGLSSGRSITDKLTYSNDTTARLPGANLPDSGRHSFAGVGNNDFGYFGGGEVSYSVVNTVLKFNYSNDTMAAEPGASLSVNRRRLGATGPRNFALPQPTFQLAAPGNPFVRFSDGAPGSPNTGYYGGGYDNPSDNLSDRSVEKLDFSTETSTRTSLISFSEQRYNHAATGNQTHGYFAGGQETVPTPATMDKVEYFTDTSAAAPSGANLSQARGRQGAVSSATAGYFGGGDAFGVFNMSTMDKLTYSTDTTARLPGANLTEGRKDIAATGNTTQGYFIASEGPEYTIVEKLTYSNDTLARVPSANMPTPGRGNAGATGNTTHGYFGGGDPGSRSNMDKITYSNDAAEAIPAGDLSTGRAHVRATGNHDAGYWAGGGGSTEFSIVDKLNYSSETTARVPGANLSAPRARHAASAARANGSTIISPPTATPTPSISSNPQLSPTPNFGYFGGGYPGRATVDKTNFGSDTTAALPSNGNLSSGRGFLNGATGSTTAGYFAGGYENISTMDKTTYSSDTTAAVPGANLTAGRHYLAATTSPSAGYFGGGRDTVATPYHSLMDKLTYSTDTMAAVPGANLPQGRGYLAATGNADAGYFNGGRDTFGPKSSMDKLTYSTETTATLPSGADLSLAPRQNIAATGNATHGYFGGGNYPAVSTMDKVTYSTDTTAYTPGANLITRRARHAATGNATHGYFASGWDDSAALSSMEKTTYASDTTAALPSSADLTNITNQRTQAATSSRANGLSGTAPITAGPNTGYFAAGNSFAGALSTVEKLDYSSETIAVVPSAVLTNQTYGNAATNSSVAGYFGAGVVGPYTTMDKLIYASDTTSQIPGASLANETYYLAATGNADAGYFGGGRYSIAAIDKVTYSTDTRSTLPSQFSPGRQRFAATGNQTHGYFCGGKQNDSDPSPQYSTTYKTTYSSDTSAQVPGAALSASRYALAATGSLDAAYFGGGDTTSNGSFSGAATIMDKLTYSTDTTAALPGADLLTERKALAATGNVTQGYFSGGAKAGLQYSSVEKVTYSTDTTSVVPSDADLEQTKYYLSATGARANGLCFGSNLI
tara:strand:- start:760 stop:4680 length:3921 start_codon:yes stop_codon:yes gene_type:complete